VVWAIYWRDRNLKFHEYKRTRPSKNVQAPSTRERFRFNV